MYDFIRNMWVMRRVTAEQIDAFAGKGYITAEQAAEIIATVQMGAE